MVNHNYQKINRSLGRPANASMVKCPAKSRQKLRSLEEAGEDHRGDSHYCEECACGNNAGERTSHAGWGWCWAHERNKNKDECARFAEKHREAIQARNPFAYRDVEAFFQDVADKGEAAGQTVKLNEELRLARGLVQKLIDTIQGNTELTEYQMGKQVTMSDKTKLELVNKMMNTVAKLGVSDFQMTTDQKVAQMKFDKALAEISTVLQMFVKPEDLPKLCDMLMKVEVV